MLSVCSSLENSKGALQKAAGSLPWGTVGTEGMGQTSAQGQQLQPHSFTLPAGSPAENAALKPGDRILFLNGLDMR